MQDSHMGPAVCVVPCYYSCDQDHKYHEMLIKFQFKANHKSYKPNRVVSGLRPNQARAVIVVLYHA